MLTRPKTGLRRFGRGERRRWRRRRRRRRRKGRAADENGQRRGAPDRAGRRSTVSALRYGGNRRDRPERYRAAARWRGEWRDRIEGRAAVRVRAVPRRKWSPWPRSGTRQRPTSVWRCRVGYSRPVRRHDRKPGRPSTPRRRRRPRRGTARRPVTTRPGAVARRGPAGANASRCRPAYRPTSGTRSPGGSWRWPPRAATEWPICRVNSATLSVSIKNHWTVTTTRSVVRKTPSGGRTYPRFGRNPLLFFLLFFAYCAFTYLLLRLNNSYIVTNDTPESI